jgi:hypothetical protein
MFFQLVRSDVRHIGTVVDKARLDVSGTAGHAETFIFAPSIFHSIFIIF